MARVLVIVSRTKPGTYPYMKLVSESEDVVILDRRNGDRRRIHQRATPERRLAERRRRDVMTDLQNPAGRWCAGRRAEESFSQLRRRAWSARRTRAPRTQRIQVLPGLVGRVGRAYAYSARNRLLMRDRRS